MILLIRSESGGALSHVHQVANAPALSLPARSRTILRAKWYFSAVPAKWARRRWPLRFFRRMGPRHPGYLSWDDPHVRPDLLRGELPGGEKLVVLDEIHKFPRWRNLVKGFYDTQGDRVSLLVTGSARLDHYRKGGDSLQGRYHHYRLHPLSLGELGAGPSPSDLDALLRFGGFPEPLLAGNMRTWRRWQRERLSRVVHEDLRDLEIVRQVALVELLAEALPGPGRVAAFGTKPERGTAGCTRHRRTLAQDS